MSNIIQSIQNLFANASAWGANLPQFILVPLVMLLATNLDVWRDSTSYASAGYTDDTSHRS